MGCGASTEAATNSSESGAGNGEQKNNNNNKDSSSAANVKPKHQKPPKPSSISTSSPEEEKPKIAMKDFLKKIAFNSGFPATSFSDLLLSKEALAEAQEQAMQEDLTAEFATDLLRAVPSNDTEAGQWFKILGRASWSEKGKKLFPLNFPHTKTMDAILENAQKATSDESVRCLCGAVSNLISKAMASKVLCATPKMADTLAGALNQIPLAEGPTPTTCEWYCGALEHLAHGNPEAVATETTRAALVNVSKRISGDDKDAVLFFLGAVEALTSSFAGEEAMEKFKKEEAIKKALENFKEVSEEAGKLVEELEKRFA